MSTSTSLERLINLRPDQNFYDQEPFTEAFIQVKEQLGDAPKNMQRLFTLTWQEYVRDNVDIFREDLSPDISQKMITPATPLDFYFQHALLHKQFVRVGDRTTIIKALAVMGESLMDKPFWLRYLFVNFDKKVYGSEGNLLRSRYGERDCAETYLSWRSRKAAEPNPNSVLWGIGDVFVQDIQGASVRQALQASGVRH